MKKRIMQILIITGVILIPLAYSLFYLGAFWDPYSKLDELPVAVVNSDEGAVINGKSRNLGNEMVERMESGKDFKWCVTGKQDATDGLSGTKYYAMIEIPPDFSSKIASAETTNKQTAIIQYAANEKRNFLASQILSRALLELEETARADVNKELTQSLRDNLMQVPGQLNDLADGLNKMHDGAATLNSGAAKLLDGQTKLTDGVSDLNGGLKDAAEGARSLATGADDLDTGMGKAAEGAKALAAGADQLKPLASGAAKLDNGAANLKQGVDQYVAGVDSLISQSSQVAAALSNYVSRNPSAAADPVLGPLLASLSSSGTQLAVLSGSGDKLKEGAADLKTGADSLTAGTAKLGSLDTGIHDLATATGKLKAGTAGIRGGAHDLAGGIAEAAKGSNALLAAAGKLETGASDLSSGTAGMLEGVDTARQKVTDAAGEATGKLQKTDGLPDFAKSPVTVENITISTIPNYGTAFAPYFMSLSLWIGAVIMFFGIYLDADNRIPLLSRSSRRKLVRVLAFAGIGLVQSCLLAFLVIRVLGLQVHNTAAFYLTCILVSMVFTSIVEFLIVTLKDAGKLLSIVFLVLQLTACGGTFPMETVPPFFKAIYRYMPMTYSVNLLKETISGINASSATHDLLVLVIIFAVFLGLTILFSLIRKSKTNSVKELAA